MKNKTFYKKGWHKAWTAENGSDHLLRHQSGLLVLIKLNDDGCVYGQPENVAEWSVEYQPNLPASARLDVLRMLLIEARDFYEYKEKRSKRIKPQ